MLNCKNNHSGKNIGPVYFLTLLCLVLLFGTFTGCGQTTAHDGAVVNAAADLAQDTPSPAAETDGQDTPSPAAETDGQDTPSPATETDGQEPAAPDISADVTDNYKALDVDSIPAWSGEAYVTLNDNIPLFAADEMTTEPFEYYSELDILGRCGAAYANVCTDIMPTEERGAIGQVRPSGWHTIKYEGIDGNYLYNRCHLIGYQLSSENANVQNLITGTRYMNVEGMLPFENMVADYVEETGNHVLYRATPIFQGDNLVADGVQLEALSVEDEGAGICFNVFCYNIQPGIIIDYATGDSETAPSAAGAEGTEGTVSESITYILNTNSKKFHYPSCSSVDQMKDANKQEYTGSRDDLISQGYDPCKRCNP